MYGGVQKEGNGSQEVNRLGVFFGRRDEKQSPNRPVFFFVPVLSISIKYYLFTFLYVFFSSHRTTPRHHRPHRETNPASRTTLPFHTGCHALSCGKKIVLQQDKCWQSATTGGTLCGPIGWLSQSYFAAVSSSVL